MSDEETLLITLSENDVSPRFDLTTEVIMTELSSNRSVAGERTIVLPHASAEDLCHLILTEGVDTVICGGIEDEFYQYLTWKKVKVIDSVIGPWTKALDLHRTRNLQAGAIILDRP